MTKILRFFIKDGKLLSSTITDAGGLPVDLPASDLPAELEALKEAAVTKAMDYDKAVAAQEAAVKSLAENQAISDQIAVTAESITEHKDLSDTEKVEAIRQLIPQARLFGKAREKAKLEAEAAAALAKAQELADKAAKL